MLRHSYFTSNEREEAAATAVLLQPVAATAAAAASVPAHSYSLGWAQKLPTVLLNGSPPIALGDVPNSGSGGSSGSPILPPPRMPLHWPHVVSAVGAGIITAVCTSPLDVIRTRLAVQQQTTVYRGLIGSLQTTWREEGIQGLYRGFGPTIIVVPLFWAVYFTLYSDLKERFNEHESIRRSPMWLKHLCAAISAGAIADVVVNPAFVVRTRMQTQHMGMHPASNPAAAGRPLYTSAFDTLIRLVREEGPMSLMRGVSASLLGLSHVCVQFPIYEWLKVSLPAISRARKSDVSWRTSIEDAMKLHPATLSRSQKGQHKPQQELEPSMWHLIAASSLSKMVASVLTFPHEVLRARLQNAPVSVFSGLVDCTKKTIKYEGIGALYKGFGVNLFRTIPGCVLTFVSYEVLLKKINQYNGN